jgi:ATP-binding cassette subfamily C protein CydC
MISLLVFVLLNSFGLSLAFVALGFLGAAGIGVPLLVRALARGLGPKQLQSRGELNARIVEGIQGAQDLLAFGREEDRVREIAALNATLGSLQGRMALITGLKDALGDLMMNLAMLSALVLAIPLVSGGEVQGVYLAFLALVVLGSFEAVQPLGTAFQFLGRSVGAGERLFEIVDSEPEIKDPAEPLPMPMEHRLEFDRVGFSYEAGGRPRRRLVHPRTRQAGSRSWVLQGPGRAPLSASCCASGTLRRVVSTSAGTTFASTPRTTCAP